MRHPGLIAFALAIAFGVSACASAWWSYDNKKYPTSEEATEAARQDVRRHVQEVQPRTAPLAESALIYTPSLAWSRQGVRTTGAASDEQIRYVSSVLYYGFYGVAEGVQRRGVFRAANITEFSQRDPLGDAKYQYVIWLRLDGPDQAQWMISPGRDTSAATPLFMSPISDAGDRIAKLVQSIEGYLSQAHEE